MRRIYKCEYCGYNWISSRIPKVCPYCHNPLRKPRYKLKTRRWRE